MKTPKHKTYLLDCPICHVDMQNHHSDGDVLVFVCDFCNGKFIVQTRYNYDAKANWARKELDKLVANA